MLRFAKNAREWLEADQDNVIAVHCKGGKGRTGTMICTWLVESGAFEQAEVGWDDGDHNDKDDDVLYIKLLSAMFSQRSGALWRLF